MSGFRVRTYDQDFNLDETIPANRYLTWRAVGGQAIEENVTGFVTRAIFSDRTVLPVHRDYFLSQEEANEQYGIEGHLRFDQAVSPHVAAEMHGVKKRELARAAILRNSDISRPEQFGVAILSSLVDPVGDGLAMVPYLGQVAKGRQVHKATTLSGRLTRGFGEGAASGIVVESVVFPLAQWEGRNYTLDDSLFNVSAVWRYRLGYPRDRGCPRASPC